MLDLKPSIIVGKNSHLDEYDRNFLSKFRAYKIIPLTRNRLIDTYNAFFKLRESMVELGSIDIVHLININPLIFSMLSKQYKETWRIKFIDTLLARYFGKPNTKDYITLYLKLLTHLRMFAGVATTSPLIFNILRRTLGEKAFFTPPPIDTDFYKPFNVTIGDTLISNIIDSKADFVALFIGDLNPYRFPVREVFKAIKRLENMGMNVLMVIVSRYSHYYDYVNSIAKKEGVQKKAKIIIKSLRPDEKIYLYNISDIVIFPFKGFTAVDPPIALLEAMSCGRIVLATAIESIPIIIKDNINGFLLDRVEPEILVEKIRTALMHKDAQDITRNARLTIVKHFSRQNTKKALQLVYEKVMDNWSTSKN